MIELAEFSGQVTAVLQVIWIPLLIWTLFAFILQIVLKYTENLHAHTHYHIRLALLLALPAGLITAGLFELSGWLQYQSADEAATYKLFIIQTPLELTVTASEYENTNLFNTANLLVFGTLILITGSVFLITGYIYSRYLLNRLTASCSLKSIHSFRAVDIKNKRLGTLSTHSVKLAITEMPVIPFTYGFKNPIIVLPKFLLQDEESLNMVLRHELMHIRHNDYLLHHVLVIIRALFWFHPLVHLLFREIIDYREIRIDSHVLEDNEISKKRYASLLLELLPFQNFEKSAAIYMARESSNLKKRINMIKMNNFRKIPKKTSLTAFASILILFSLFMACTDLQNHNILDDEDINMMADFDVQGDRGHHEIVLFMSSPDQRERNNEKLQQLNQIHPDDILSIDVYKDEHAIQEFGDRALHGAIVVKLKTDSPGMKQTFDTFGIRMPDTATEPAVTAANDEDYFVVVEEMPELIGGLAQLQQSITYPETARRAGIEGRVFVQFIVNENGDVENARVIRGIGGGADEEALRAVQLAKFKAGYQRGQPVRVQYSLPIVFRLSESNTTEK